MERARPRAVTALPGWRSPPTRFCERHPSEEWVETADGEALPWQPGQRWGWTRCSERRVGQKGLSGPYARGLRSWARQLDSTFQAPENSPITQDRHSKPGSQASGAGSLGG